MIYNYIILWINNKKSNVNIKFTFSTNFKNCDLATPGSPNKRTLISPRILILSGSCLVSLSGYNVFEAFIHAFLDFVNRALNSLADPWNAGIVLQVLAIGGIINLVAKLNNSSYLCKII